MKKAEYMQQFLGEEFEGIISSVVKFGFFVELPNTVEGLVHIQSLEDDYYHFIENHLALVGERTKRVLKVGQKVKVKVLGANPDSREIDFQLVEVLEEAQVPKSLHQVKTKNSPKQQKTKKNNRAKGKRKGKNKKQKPFYKEVVKNKKKKKH